MLTIAGSDSGGGAGIQADLKVLTLLGIHGLTVTTAVTAQNTKGVQRTFPLALEAVTTQLESVLSDSQVDAAKTGMLVDADIVRAVAEKLRQYQVPNLVVDPVISAQNGSPLLRFEALETLKNEVFPLARVVTPNLLEASRLSGIEVRSRQDMTEAAERIYALGPEYVVITGGHLRDEATDVIYDGDDFQFLEASRVAERQVHGTGCTFSAAIAGLLAQGHGLLEAVERAKEIVREAIKEAYYPGTGSPVVNQLRPRIP